MSPSALTTPQDKAKRKESPKHVNFSRGHSVVIIPPEMETWANSSPPSSPTPEREIWAKKNVDDELAALGSASGLAEPVETVADQKKSPQKPPPKQTFGDILGKVGASEPVGEPPKPKRRASNQWQSAIAGIMEKGKTRLSEKPKIVTERTHHGPNPFNQAMSMGNQEIGIIPHPVGTSGRPPKKASSQPPSSKDPDKNPTSTSPARTPTRKPIPPPKKAYLSSPTLLPTPPSFSTSPNRNISGPPQLPPHLKPAQGFSRSEEALSLPPRSPFQRNAFPSPEIHPLRGNPVTPPQSQTLLSSEPSEPSPPTSTHSLPHYSSNVHEHQTLDFSDFVPTEQMATMTGLDEEERERKAAQRSTRLKDRAKRFSKMVVDKGVERMDKKNGSGF
ncbi:uncharacterized protein BDR25DRAFT_343031 [Lindgomyces ingoldianus]|uniref:Uncharacterized protein n=1 Tax=Lindgomyces ingoldianus TaxID=673940 RepID=A0ACB6QWZ4_9PLEO|nr:uncharacterized protein BDR25DRAFT_343031 [Lindgomyces ingoldianus]KAF2470802.1 hypothetical protein BDR25DRAFT_343031 [Lindgomyces ingoldianus]